MVLLDIINSLRKYSTTPVAAELTNYEELYYPILHDRIVFPENLLSKYTVYKSNYNNVQLHFGDDSFLKRFEGPNALIKALLCILDPFFGTRDSLRNIIQEICQYFYKNKKKLQIKKRNAYIESDIRGNLISPHSRKVVANYFEINLCLSTINRGWSKIYNDYDGALPTAVIICSSPSDTVVNALLNHKTQSLLNKKRFEELFNHQ